MLIPHLPTGKKSFLLLQGPCTPFFGCLGASLKREGHTVQRVNFCGGDVLYWGMQNSRRYSGNVTDLRHFLLEQYTRLAITDQVLFGDQRPVHRPAILHAETCGVRTHVFEEGYFRPWWVTLEREGVNGHSLLPRDPDWFRNVGHKLQAVDAPVAFRAPFHLRAFHDVAYHVAGLVNPFLFSGYRNHAPVSAPVEYAAYLRRFAWLRMIRNRERERVQNLLGSGKRFFLLPLQLNSDAQIRDHSRFADMGEVIEYVLASFASHAPAQALLVIKNHPLDMGLMNFGRIITACAQRFDLVGRVIYLEEGDLQALVAQAEGVVTVNSTVGMVSLAEQRPTLSLSDPIYNLPGLTFQGGIDTFWRSEFVPDPDLFAAFRKVIFHATQINGGFYSGKGIELAVENSVRVLTASRSPLECLL